MAHKIAIILTRDINYYDDYTKIVDSITDWEEITNEEYNTLQYAASRLGFTMIEQPVDTKAFVAKTITDYLAISKAEKIRADAEKAKREQAAVDRKYKKQLKDTSSKEKLLKQLVAELGPESLKSII